MYWLQGPKPRGLPENRPENNPWVMMGYLSQNKNAFKLDNVNINKPYCATHSSPKTTSSLRLGEQKLSTNTPTKKIQIQKKPLATFQRTNLETFAFTSLTQPSNAMLGSQYDDTKYVGLTKYRTAPTLGILTSFGERGGILIKCTDM